MGCSDGAMVVRDIRPHLPLIAGPQGLQKNQWPKSIYAATGYLPVFTDGFSHWPRQGDFRLEGVFFDEAYFMGDFRNLTVRNCAFRATHSEWTMGLHVAGAGDPVRFVNCVSFLGLGAGLGKGRTLVVDNCLFTPAARLCR